MVHEATVMSDDLEQLLGQLRPRGPANELRPLVLGAVDNELSRRGSVPWLRGYAAIVAAALLLGVFVNYWVSARQEERLAGIIGPPPVPRTVAEVAKAVAEVTDAETAGRLQEQWCQAYWEHYKQVTRQRAGAS
jgi:hypothetical protein